MGLFDIVTGRHAPALAAARLSEGDVPSALLGLNCDTSPVVVRLDRDGEEGADLVAE